MTEAELSRAADFIIRLAGNGIRVRVDGDRVALSPKEGVRPWIAARVKQYKPAILALDKEYQDELTTERQAIQSM